MTKNNTLRQAITLTLASGALALGVAQSAAASTTMYNLYNGSLEPRVSDGPAYPIEGSESGASDGWMWGQISQESRGNPYDADPGWLGTEPNKTFSSYAPFGTTTAMAVNWAAHITQAGDNLEISQAEAVARFGPALLQESEGIYYPDIDTSGGAWANKDGQGKLTTIDVGLLKSDITQTISLSITGLTHPEDNFGITVYTGLSNNDYYNHHGFYRFDSQRPFQDIPYLTHTPRDPQTGLTSNSLNFTAEAGQIYTILLGGNNAEDWEVQYDSYVLNIQTSPVPLPGALWLFGSALAGFFGVQRRKSLHRGLKYSEKS